MKPLSLDADTASRFWKMYQDAWKHLADVNRNFQTFQMMCYDRSTQMFHGPGDTIVVFSEVNVPMHTASLHVFSERPWAFRKREEFWSLFLEVMELFRLHKLSVFIPGPTAVICRLYEFLGFLREGTLRDTVMFDGELVDMAMYGLLRCELEDKTVAKRTRRKSSLIERAGLKRAG